MQAVSPCGEVLLLYYKSFISLKTKINSPSLNIDITDYDFGFLKNLKHDRKVNLITKLSESLKMSEKKENISLQSLSGTYKSAESAEQINVELRASTTFNRNTESL